MFDTLGDMIEKDWADKGRAGTPRVGFDVVAFGNYQKIFSKAARMAAEKRGWEYIITYTSIVPADVTTQVLQIKEFECDYIYLMTPESAVIVWLRELERQNVKPIIFGSTGLASGEIWTATGEVCLGSRFYQYSPVWSETDLPMVKLIQDLNAEWHPEVTSRPSHYIRGFEHVLVVAEALKRAIDNVGFENLSAEAVKDAMETFRDFRPTENGTSYTWTPDDHQGVHGCRWYEWAEGGTQIRASDWYSFKPLPEEQRTNAWWLAD